MKPVARILLPLALVATCAAQRKEDPFAAGVRTSEPLSPGEQQKTFQLPPGFEIQLVAAEPNLRKPMNMQFDTLGRLWVTESREYPFPAKAGQPLRDTVTVFSDFGTDGKAKKVEVFADNLNIPIGLYPFRSPDAAGKVTQKCIVWSIPNIWLMEDTDGDGKADKRDVLFGPLGWEKDTHGNQASFRRGNDGWLYGTHGFNNHSVFKAKDGSTIDLTSGNTWRIRTDGSRVEQHTWGQVNPFGLCWDDRGNLFSADCHSSPLYQLLRGGSYPSFGKPHDGLGFAPITLQHSHGSTAICAPIMVQDTSWPAELQGHVFIGNVMTSRLNHDLIEWKGASSKGKEQPDFLTATDPWFRPVDLQWGPDGALYIADFYNRIIGHYEVPLNHPGRDRERGRLWRIVYRGGKGGHSAPMALPADAAGLVKELASANPTRRSLALNDLCDRVGKDSIGALQAAFGKPANGFQKVGAMWALLRLGSLKESDVAGAIAAADPLVRTHAMRVADAIPKWSDDFAAKVREALNDPDAIVRRCAAEALGSHPAVENFRPLLDLIKRTAREDDHLIHSTRIAVRDQLRASSVVSKLSLDGFAAEDLKPVLEIMLAVPGEQTALLRLALFEKIDVPVADLAKQLPSIARSVPYERLESIAALARRKLGNDLTTQAALVANILNAIDQRGAKPGQELTDWAATLAPQLLSASAGGTGWTVKASGKSPFTLQGRKCADGQDAQLISSHPRGETLTGVLRSAPFALPASFRFYVCGHDGSPDKPAGKKNYIRLLDAADGKVLREAAPPRNDTAQRIEWDLKDVAGRRGILEITDGDKGDAYAWLAFGRFRPELPELAIVEPGGPDIRRLMGLELISRFRLAELAPNAGALLLDPANDTETRSSAASALIKIAPDEGVQKTTAVLRDAPAALQTALARTLAGTREGASALLVAMNNGQAAPALLRDPSLVAAIKASNLSGVNETIEKLTAKLPPANAEADKLIAARRQSFDSAGGDAAKGAQLYQTQCAVCHRIGNVGNLVGPQLDGIGSRGADRIIEDILDPNRNVDRAFRLTLVTQKDGNVVSGLVRREEGAQLVLADVTGKEVTVLLAQVAKREEIDTSLMPPAFGQMIPPGDFNDLLAYLVSQKATK